MSAELILAAVGSAGFTGLVATVVNGILNRKKLSADATKIITEAASGVVERLEAELTRKDREHKEREQVLEDRLDRLETYIAEWRDVAQLHAAWDEIVQYEAREAGFSEKIPAAPPLMPPPASRVRPRG